MRFLKSEAGFSLIEVMTAVLIFSVGMLGVASMLTTSINTDSFTADVRVGEHLAKAKLEELRGKSPTGIIAPQAPSSATVTGDDPSSFRKYTRQLTINPVDCRPCIVSMCNVDPTCKFPVAPAVVIVGWPRGTNCTNTAPLNCKHTVRLEGYIIQPACPNCD
jgi:prepilin-type N-terminal cleavage/methylation domain-containing protein